MSEFRILLSPFRGLAAMLCILVWLLCGMGILCVMVFCRKRKGALPVVDREVMISESVSNIAAVTLLLTQLLFPVYGYLMNPLAGSYLGRMDPVGKVLARLLTTHNIHCFEPFDWYGDNSVYMWRQQRIYVRDSDSSVLLFCRYVCLQERVEDKA